MYLNKFVLPSPGEEETFLHNDIRLKGTSYKSVYPFMLFSKRYFGELDFSPITILYGGNGSGKTSILNVIAEKLKLNRGTYFNQSPFFDDYVNLCEYDMAENISRIPAESRIIASDDVFDYMLDVRCINQNIDEKREFLMAMKGAYVYDLDSVPVERKRWTELKNVRLYYEFFKSHEAIF